MEIVVVNVHHFADMLEAHLRTRQRPRDRRVGRARGGSGNRRRRQESPAVAGRRRRSSRSIPIRSGSRARSPTFPGLIAAWDPERMDILMLVAPRATSVGYEGQGDFSRDGRAGCGARRTAKCVPFVYAGVAIVKPEMAQDTPEGPFSANLFYDRAIARDRLYGLELDGQWLHVGEPHSIAEAEACLRAGCDEHGRPRLFHSARQRHSCRPWSMRFSTGRLVGALPADPAALADITIYVPTRRATRALIALLAERGGAKAQLLPRIVPARRSRRGRVRTDGPRGHAARGSGRPQAPDSAARAPADPDAADPALVGAGRPHAAAAGPRRPVPRAGVAGRCGQSRGRSRNAHGSPSPPRESDWHALELAVDADFSEYFRITRNFVQIVSAISGRRFWRSGRRAIRRRGAAR